MSRRASADVCKTPPDVLTPAQAAELLQVAIATLLRSPVPYCTIGTGHKRPRRRYLRATVLEWLKTQEHAA